MATGRSLTLPIGFDAVSAGPAGPFGEKTLRVGKDIKIAHLRQAIVLATGSVEISHASDCIVLAGGAIDVSHGNRNLLIAGHFVEVSHDGSELRRAAASAGKPRTSLIMSGSAVDIAHAGGTVVCAPKLVTIAHANNVVFVNSPTRETSHEQFSQIVTAKIPFDSPEQTSPLPEGTNFSQLVARSTRPFVVVERNGVEYVWRPGTQLRDEKGVPLKETAGWKVTRIYERLLLLDSGKEMFSQVMPR